MLACSPNLAEDLDTVYKLVYNISLTTSPSEINVSRMSAWYVTIMAAADIFCVHKSMQKAAQGKACKEIVLHGREALAQVWNDHVVTKQGAKIEEHLKFLRTFQWMLTVEQRSDVQKCVNSLVANAKAKCLGVVSIADGCVDEDAGSGAKSAGSSSSSVGSGAKAPVITIGDAASSSSKVPAPGASAGEKKKFIDKEAQKNALMSMFKKQKHSAK